MQQSRERVCVSIVNYNTWGDTVRAVRSVLEERSRNLEVEVLVLDNGREEPPHDPWLARPGVAIVRCAENIGFGRGHNKNASLTDAQWLLILNPDTVVLPGAIDTLVKVARSNAGVAAVVPQLVGPDGVVERSCRRFPGVWREVARAFGLDRLAPFGLTYRNWDHASRRAVLQPPGAAILLSKEVFDCASGFDERFAMYFEDVDLCKRLWQIGFILFEPDAKVVHSREGTAKKFRSQSVFWIERSRMVYIRKHQTGLGQRVATVSAVTGAVLRAAAFSILSVLGTAGARERAVGYWSSVKANVGIGSARRWAEAMMPK